MSFMLHKTCEKKNLPFYRNDTKSFDKGVESTPLALWATPKRLALNRVKYGWNCTTIKNNRHSYVGVPCNKVKRLSMKEFFYCIYAIALILHTKCQKLT